MSRLPGRFLVALACEGKVRVMAAVVDGPADEVRERHALEATSAVLAAEGLVASLLLSAHIKGEERISVEIRGVKPALVFQADIDATGFLRARFTPTRTHPMRRIEGVLSVMKSLGSETLYRGVAEVKNERFEAALHRYLTESQQVDARVRIHAEVDAAGAVRFASGLLVERMPGMSAETFAALFDTALSGNFTELMTGFAFGQLVGFPLEILGSQDFVYRCSCSHERVLEMLAALGAPEIESLRAEQGRAEVTCHYCNTRYEVDDAGLASLLG